MYSEQQLAAMTEILGEGDDEIFLRLSVEVNNEQARALPPSRKEAIEKAKQWLEDNRSKIAELVCSEKILLAVDDLKKKDGRQALLLLVDGLLASFGLFPAVCISVLLLRQSLEAWCQQK